MIFDLSVVTDTLIGLVNAAWQNAPLWTAATPQFAVSLTGLSPDAARQAVGAQLSLYLYHIDENKATESLFWTPQAQTAGGPPLRYQPLALDLYYLLSAYEPGNYVHEQQAMSIGMRVFHENPMVSGTSRDGTKWEVTLNLESRSYDELSRLWQATTSALRLSAVYRAAVVLIEPEPGPGLAPPVQVRNVVVGQGAGSGPLLLAAYREVQYVVPGGATVTFVQEPATVAAGGQVWLAGSGLDAVTAQRLILTGPYPGNAETDVSAWIPAVALPVPSNRRAVTLPGATGAPPGGAPPPGRYTMRLEGTTGTGADAVAFRTADVPLSVAAGVSPAGGPLLAKAASYAVTGTGFQPGGMQVLLGTVPLTQAAGAAPTAGEYAVSPAGTGLTLVPPAGIPAGTYQIRVRVAGVESDPALWLQAS